MPAILRDRYQRVISDIRAPCNIQPLQPYTVIGNCQQCVIRYRLQKRYIQREKTPIPLNQITDTTIGQSPAVRQREPFYPLAVDERLQSPVTDLIVDL